MRGNGSSVTCSRSTLIVAEEEAIDFNLFYIYSRPGIALGFALDLICSLELLNLETQDKLNNVWGPFSLLDRSCCDSYLPSWLALTCHYSSNIFCLFIGFRGHIWQCSAVLREPSIARNQTWTSSMWMCNSPLNHLPNPKPIVFFLRQRHCFLILSYWWDLTFHFLPLNMWV